MFKGIGNPRGPIAPAGPRGTLHPVTRTTHARPQGPVDLASRGGPPDPSIRPRTALPLPAREPSAQAAQASPPVPDLASLPSLDGPGAFAAAWKQQQVQTERAEVALKPAIAEPTLARARERLTIGTGTPPAQAMTPLSRQEAPVGMQQRARGPTLGELFAQESRQQRQELLRTALPSGGAVMQRLKERAGRQHPTTNAEQWRARLKGPPQSMEGRRKEAFEARVRTDVLAVAKTGRMEPRLAAEAMHAAVLDGTLGQGILPQDRQLLLATLDRMAKGGPLPAPPGQLAGMQGSTAPVPLHPNTAQATHHAQATPPAGDRFADQRLAAGPLPPGTRYPEAVSLIKKYAGEETGAVWGTQVAYLNAEQRQQFQLHMQDGRLYDAQGRPFDTRGAQSSFLETEGTAIFVMNPNGDIYAANDRVPGKFQHSSFLAGAPVAAAGEIEVHDGVVKFISGKSGHYRPGADQLDQMVHNLKSQGAADFSIDQTAW